MTNKKRIIIGTIVVIGLSFLFHSVYDKFPNTLTSILFPVNESIFEHNKMILLSFFIWSLIDKFLLKNDRPFLTNFIAAIICILILDVTFTPIYLYVLKMNDNLVLVIALYVVSTIIGLISASNIVKKISTFDDNEHLLSFLVLALVFAFLTYNPPHLAIFFDYTGGFYGINQK